MHRIVVLLLAVATGVIGACSSDRDGTDAEAAGLVLVNGRVYTFRWPEPSADGLPDSAAPIGTDGWHPDAEAVAMRDGSIVYVGTNTGAERYVTADTRVVDLGGATVIPGLVDSHTHVFGLGAKLTQIDLIGIEDEEQAVALVAERAKQVAPGDWIVGSGWDEGAWADNYPDKTLLSAAVPDHPVVLDSLHGFAAWTNQAALDAGAITAATTVPVGGEMRLGADGEPSGLFLNNATTLVDGIVPPPSRETLIERVLAGLGRMAEDGYVAVHDAGLDSQAMDVLEQLEREDRLPIRVYAMLSLRDEDLVRRWIGKGPDADNDSMLVTRTVKAYYDGALGSRGARLLYDYEDRPGHRGLSGDGYGFNEALNAEAMKAGFQIAIHAIGDAGNREALDILEGVFGEAPATRSGRHRIEHAQVIHPDDIPRLGQLGIIASMEPPHAMEDKAWAEDRLGAERILGAYAWRSLRKAGASLTFNSDNPGSDHNIFYGLHSAITRQDRDLQPEGGWYAAERMAAGEAIRAYTSWSAYASFREQDTGVVDAGRWADLTVMDIDPLRLADEAPATILDGRILMTIVAGDVVFEADDAF